MSWGVCGNNLTMTEEDFGVELPVTVDVGVTLSELDEIELVVKDKLHGEDLITKTFSNIVNNTVSLVISRAESALLPIGDYVYRLDWLQAGHFMCNVIDAAKFKVVKKA